MVAALSEAELTERVEALRIPVSLPGTPLDWKDWYHFVLLDLASGWRAIVNVSLSASDEHAELQLTLVVHEGPCPTGAAMHGCSLSVPWLAGMVQARPLRVHTAALSFEFTQQVFRLRAAPPGSAIQIEFEARPDATPLLVTEASPFGSGFIGWGVMPRLRAQGRLRVGEREVAVDPAWFCYQDHNFGRFRWGDDFGWEWLVAHLRCDDTPEADPLTVVVDVRCDRLHSRSGLPYLFVLAGRNVRKVFLGPAMRLRWHWAGQAALPPRLPGAMATLLADRSLRAPVEIEVIAADELDSLHLRIHVDAYLEIVAPDNRGAGLARIGECSGPAELVFTQAGQAWRGHGLAYAGVHAVRPASPAEAVLTGWLQRLVELLLAAGGAVARQLERSVLDKLAGLQLDEACLVLGATRDRAGQLSVQIEPAQPGATPPRQLATSARALREIIEGQALLDAAVADGRVDLRAPLADLLAFHELVMLTLALAPRSPALRALWTEFDSTWPRDAASATPRAQPLPSSAHAMAPLVAAVPADVALARSPAAGE